MNATITHDARCVANAETSVRENCANILIAATWDLTAIKAEDAWVTAWAAEWLLDGTSTCLCAAKTVQS